MFQMSAMFTSAIGAILVLPAFAQEAKEAAAPRLNIVQTAAKAGQFETLLAAAKAAGLVETLESEGPFTVFAPTDAAFEALPEGTVPALLKDTDKLAAILKYHVVAGSAPSASLRDGMWVDTVLGQAVHVTTSDDGVMVDDSHVVKADIRATNGVIHVVDKVIMPRPDIVEIAMGAGSFDTLCKCVVAADLVETLKGAGPFTVFAPTDDAFAAIPKATLDGLTADKTKLTSVLTYHVVSGRVMAGDLFESPKGEAKVEPKTVQGQTLTIARDADGNVTVNGARVVRTDIIAGNGVIHVIDAVVLPE